VPIEEEEEEEEEEGGGGGGGGGGEEEEEECQYYGFSVKIYFQHYFSRVMNSLNHTNQ
jgi:hypothetical protein